MTRLLVMDVDSTLITAEVIELIAERAGTREEVARITEAAMRGELDFAASLKERVATLAGVPDTVFEDVLAEIQFSPGAPELVAAAQAAGWDVALVSGGFAEIVESLAARLGITRFRANRLEVEDGALTGRTVGPVIDREAKEQALREYAAELGVALEDTVAIGDGANDLAMMSAAGLGIAFNAKPVVREQADASIEGRLDHARELLGI
jgi:phosphoserine phosphatase